MMKRMLDGICQLVMLVITCLTAVIVISIATQVFWRYVLNNALVWPEEVSRYCFIWACCLGMSVGVRRGDLIAIDVLWENKPKRTRLIVSIVARLLTIPLLVVFVWQGANLVRIVANQLTASTQLPVGWVYVALPASCVLALIFLFENLTADIRNFLSGAEEAPK
jgi:TRAP-type C4-dicarboxylate transport system permease small subunit